MIGERRRDCWKKSREKGVWRVRRKKRGDGE
jgi:hypothetical protein